MIRSRTGACGAACRSQPLSSTCRRSFAKARVPKASGLPWSRRDDGARLSTLKAMGLADTVDTAGDTLRGSLRKAGLPLANDRGAGRHFVTLYELDGLDALETGACRHLPANPTPASARMRPALRDTRRQAFEIIFRAEGTRGDRLAMLDAVDLAEGLALVETPAAIDGSSPTLGRSVGIQPHPAFRSAEPEHYPDGMLFAEARGSAGQISVESALRRPLGWHRLIFEHSTAERSFGMSS